MGNEEAEIGIGIGVAGEASDVGSRREGKGAGEVVEPVWVEKEGAFHAQVAGQGVHVRDEVADGVEAGGIGQFASDMVRDGGGGDIVGGHERRVEEVAEGEGVARLQTGGIDAADSHGGGRDLDHFAQGNQVHFGGIQNNGGRGDFGEAGDLSAFVASLGGEDMAGAVVKKDVIGISGKGGLAGEPDAECQA